MGRYTFFFNPDKKNPKEQAYWPPKKGENKYKGTKITPENTVNFRVRKGNELANGQPYDRYWGE